MNRRQQHEIAAVVAAEIMRGPASLKAMCLALGLRDRSTGIPRKYVQAFKLRGLVYVHSYSFNHNELWAWQPSPFFLPDAPKPLNHAERMEREAQIRREETQLRRLKEEKLRQEAQKRDKPLKRPTMPGANVPNSVFALGVV